MKAIITVVGKDKAGIVAGVAISRTALLNQMSLSSD